MPIESIGAESTNSVANTQNSTLGQEDLFKILLTELTFQDPLEPMDNKDFIAQLAQFTNLEQTRQFNDKLDALLTVQAADQSIALLGKTIEFKTETVPEIGDVIAVSFSEGSPIMTIKKPDGTFVSDIRLSQINSVN